jgi:hypothetical protein
MATTVKVTSKGREVIAGRLKAATPTQAEALNVGWGTIGATPNATVFDVGLYKEAAEARVAGASSFVTTTSSGDTYQVVGTITSAGAQTISEAALSDAASKPFATTWATAPTTTAGTSGTSAASYTPANNSFIQDQSGEVMQVTAGSGGTSLTVVRGANGSTAVTSANGNAITLGNAPGRTDTNATLMVHATFTGLALNASDSIQFTFQVQITSS